SLAAGPVPENETGRVVGGALVVEVAVALVVDVAAEPVVDVTAAPVVDVEVEVDVVVPAAELNSKSSKYTVASVAEFNWNVAKNRMLCVAPSTSALTVGGVCQTPSVAMGVTKDAPTPADTTPLLPVQSFAVYAFAVNVAWTTALDAVRYENRNVGIEVPPEMTTQSLWARTSVALPSFW